MTATVKKAFAPILAILTSAIEANPKATIKSVIDQVTAEASAKTTRPEGAASIKDSENKTLAIRDYYFKRWMPVVGSKTVDVGQKQGTNTGFNSMSKAGVSEWTKQNRQLKADKEQMMKDIVAGTLAPSDIPTREKEIEEKARTIVATDLGFETEEQVREYLVSEGFTPAA